MELELKILSSQDTNDFIERMKIFGNVFEMGDLKILDNTYLESLMNKPDLLVLIAKCNNEVIGGLTVYVLHRYYSTKPIAYIYDVGVKPDHQRKGIGKKLISHLIQYCKENDFEDAYVEAETDDIQAVNFYKTTQTTSILQATHFTYSFDIPNRYNDPCWLRKLT